MSTIHPSPFLRKALLLDAAASGATGLLLIGGAGFLDGLLGLPVALMREAGLILVPFVAFVVAATVTHIGPATAGTTTQGRQALRRRPSRIGRSRKW